MPPLVLIDEFGNPLMWDKPKPPSEDVEEPLHVIAAREAQRVSTKKDTKKDTNK